MRQKCTILICRGHIKFNLGSIFSILHVFLNFFIFVCMRALHRPKYTVSDYNLWEGQWELIDGIPYAMSPSPIFNHQWFANCISAEIIFAFRNQKKTCKDCKVVQDVDWIINESMVLKPDVAIVCHQKSKFITTVPVLVIETLSPSTALKDRHTKYEIYEEQGVKYYIIADAEAKTYQTHILVNGKYEEQDIKEFTIHEGCTIALDIAQIMQEL